MRASLEGGDTPGRPNTLQQQRPHLWITCMVKPKGKKEDAVYKY